MRTTRILKFITLLFAIIVSSGCVNDDEFNVPENSDVTAADLNADVITVSNLIGLYNQALNSELNALGVNPNNVEDVQAVKDNFTIDLSDNENFISGFVVSSDENGNFFEEIIIQDKAENPTAGVRVLIDDSPLFASYEFGRLVFVKLAGLRLGDSNGVLTLGIGRDLDKIAAAVREDFVKRSSDVVEIVPLAIAIGDFSEALENVFVQLSNVQFVDQLIEDEITFAGEAEDRFDGERFFINCDSGQQAILSTSTFASFKSATLPAGRGMIQGVLTRNFFGDTFNIAINERSDVSLEEERCVIVDLTCEGDAIEGTETIFIARFQDITDEDELDGSWTNVNINGGNSRFVLDDFDNNNYLRISGFNTNENPLEVWLVTPAINLDNTIDEALSFRTQAAFDNGKLLKVFITNEYTGDPTTTEWTQIDANIPTGPASSFGQFEFSGLINLSCVEGDLNVGFFYEGADPGATTRYHIDDIRIQANL